MSYEDSNHRHDDLSSFLRVESFLRVPYITLADIHTFATPAATTVILKLSLLLLLLIQRILLQIIMDVLRKMMGGLSVHSDEREEKGREINVDRAPFLHPDKYVLLLLILLILLILLLLLTTT